MPEQRRTYKHGDSLVVALPARVREHLKLGPGREVYWHITRGKEIVLALTSKRAGGHPEGVSLQKQVIELERELARLRRKASARPERAVNMGIAHGWSQAMRVNRETLDLVQWLDGRLTEILERIPFRRRAGRGSHPSPVTDRRNVETIPAPILSPPEKLGGADTSGGEAPQVSHSEITPQGR
jgi:antitoxin component of MazEF toxin-antitoxin module